MARASKAAPPPRAGMDQDRHLAFLAYQLGLAGVAFPALAGHFWRTAEPEDALPPQLDVEVGRLRDTTARLLPLVQGGRGSSLMQEVHERSEQARLKLEEAWDGPEHHEWMRRRDLWDLDGLPWGDQSENSPLRLPVWQELGRAVEAFTAALPPEVARWVRLGALVGRVLDPLEGGGPGVRAIPELQNHRSEMGSQPLLAGLMLDPGCASRERVIAWNRQLCARLSSDDPVGLATAPKDSSQQPQSLEEQVPPEMGKDLKQLKALDLLTKHPGMSDKKIAEMVGCARTSLYRMPLYMEAKKLIAEGRSRVRRGVPSRGRAGGTVVDGIDEREPCDGLDES